jgi:hypothetical protein
MATLDGHDPEQRQDKAPLQVKGQATFELQDAL